MVAVVEVTPWTFSLKVAVMAPALRLTFTALAAGLVAMTVGTGLATSVVKLHDVVANAAHVPSRVRIPDAGATHVPPVITTVYSVEGARLAVGLIVTPFNPLKVTATFWRTPLAVPRNNLTLVLPFKAVVLVPVLMPCTIVLNVAVMLFPTGKFTPPLAGTRWVRTGAGAAAGVTVLDSAENGPGPVKLTAATANV